MLMFRLFDAVGNIVQGQYCFTNNLLMLEAAVPHEVVLPDECSRVTTPLDPDMWSLLLSTHPDRRFVDYIIRGICCGFRIGCRASAQMLQSSASNMFSAALHPEVIDKYLREELQANRVVEVPHESISAIHISRFGVIPKKHQPGRWRLIVDLSYPQEQTVKCSLLYASVE